jgi:hypothetical protein
MTYNYGNGGGHDPRNNQRGYDSRNDQRGYDSRDPRNQQSGGGQPQDERPKRTKAELKLPEGDYMVECIDHSWGAGNPYEQIGVACRIVEGPFAGQVRSWYGSLSPAAEEYTLRGMKAFGFVGDNILDCKSMYRATGGKIARATLEHHEWQGDWSERFAFINGDGVAMKNPLDQAGLQRLQQRMRATLQRSGGAPKNDGGGYNPGNYQNQAPPPRQPPTQRDLEELRREEEAKRSGGGGERAPWDDVPPPDAPQGRPPRGDRW